MCVKQKITFDGDHTINTRLFFNHPTDNSLLKGQRTE